jgi:hypothetical protein
MGCVGCISFCRSLGSLHLYALDNHISIRKEGDTLTISYPGAPESIIDLDALDAKDRRALQFLLRQWCVEERRVPEEDEVANDGPGTQAVLVGYGIN